MPGWGSSRTQSSERSRTTTVGSYAGIEILEMVRREALLPSLCLVQNQVVLVLGCSFRFECGFRRIRKVVSYPCPCFICPLPPGLVFACDYFLKSIDFIQESSAQRARGRPGAFLWVDSIGFGPGHRVPVFLAFALDIDADMCFLSARRPFCLCLGDGSCDW